MEKREDGWYRIDPVMPFQNFCDFCRYLRGKPNSETDIECVSWYFGKAEEILRSGSYQPKHFPCYVNLRVVAFPVVIVGEIVALLFSGQKRFEGMDDEEARRMANKHNHLSFRKMKSLFRKMDIATESDIEVFMNKFDPMVKHITVLGEQNYVVQKRLREEQLLDELSFYFEYNYETDISPLWNRLEKVLKRIIEFTDTTKATMFLISEHEESDTLSCKVVAGLPKEIMPHVRGFEDILETGVPMRLDLSTDGHTLLQNVESSLKNLAYYLIPISVKPGLDGFFAFGNAEEVGSVNVEAAILVEIAYLVSRHVQRAYFEVALHQQNREREKNIQELEEVNRAREEFMTEMSHALRAPMQSIVSEAEYLAHHCSRMHHHDEEIVKSTNNLIEEVGILKNKLDNSLFSGDMEIEYDLRENSLVSLIDECADRFRDIARRERDINIIVQVDGIPDFKFDRDNMDIVFTNLLDNAIKFSHGGKDIYVRGTVVWNEVKVEVEDFGLGIEEEEKGKIFQKYYRGELKDRRRFISGTGIGLTVARKIVEDHGGMIYVDSRPAAGIDHDPEKLKAGEAFITTFTVSLPYQMNEEKK